MWKQVIRSFWWGILLYATVCVGYGVRLLWLGVPSPDEIRFPHPITVFLLINAILLAIVAPTRGATPLNGWDGIGAVHPNIVNRIRGVIKLVTITLVAAVILLGVAHAYTDWLELTVRRRVILAAAILGVLYPAVVFAIMALVGRAGVIAPRHPSQPPTLYRVRVWLERHFGNPNK